MSVSRFLRGTMCLIAFFGATSRICAQLEPTRQSEPRKVEKQSDQKKLGKLQSDTEKLDGKWRLVLSEWSMRGSVLRERDKNAGLGIAVFGAAAKELQIQEVELSSQLVEVDLRRELSFSEQSDSVERKKEERDSRTAALLKMRECLVGRTVSQVSIDHLQPLTQEDHDVPSNVAEYAEWIANNGAGLGTRTFSIVVAEREPSRDEAAKRAVAALLTLAAKIRGLEKQRDEETEPSEGSNAKQERAKQHRDQPNRPERDQNLATEGDKERTLNEGRSTEELPPLQILIESGEGFRSDPKWLAEIVRSVRAGLKAQELRDIDCRILLNLGRQRVENSDAAMWIGLALPEDAPQRDSVIGGVIAETQTFIVAPSKEDSTRVQILAERRVDYARSLRTISPLADRDTPVIVRYVGPSLYEISGVEASVSLFNILLKPEFAEKPQTESDEPKDEK